MLYAGVFVHFWRAPFLRHISDFGVCECVEASCGFAARCDGVCFWNLGYVWSGAPAFGGVRIPGAVAHIEIGLEVNTWKSGPASGAGLLEGPAC